MTASKFHGANCVKVGPTTVVSSKCRGCGEEIIAILGEAHQAAEDARARGSTALGADLLDKLRQRYEDAVAFGIIHNRLWDWGSGNYPAKRSAAGCATAKEQVFLFTRDFAVDRTTNVAERGPTWWGAGVRSRSPGRDRQSGFCGVMSCGGTRQRRTSCARG